MKINCPNCNSKQTFTIKERVEKDLIVKYVCCLMCFEEIVIDTYPANIQKDKQRASILKLRNTRRELKLRNG